MKLRHIFSQKIIEMENNSERSFCCGSGRGRMWMQDHTGERISELHIAEALKTKAYLGEPIRQGI